MTRLSALLVCLAGAAKAHLGAPVGLSLSDEGGVLTAVLTRPTPVAQAVSLELPVDCVLEMREEAPAPTGQVADRLRYRCANALRGRRLRVAGLADAGLPALVRYADGAGTSEALLQVSSDTWAPPALHAGEARPALDAFLAALSVGARHFLQGGDHVLFVVGVVLLPLSWRRRVSSLTAFTAGHSLTLALAAFGVWVPAAAWVELGIALSLVVLALEAVQQRAPKAPELVTGGFGLLHGLGFVGAFAGLRPELATLGGFNVGLELSQLLVVLAAAALGRLALRAAPLAPARAVAGYAMGTLAASWCIERGLALAAELLS